MSKILITGGCSFSECLSPRERIATWPRHLEDYLTKHGYTEIVHCGLGSSGNGLISRKIIYSVAEALKKYTPENIFVGVMWSGPDRHDFRCFSPELLKFNTQHVHNGWQRNPVGFVSNAPENWVIMNHHWAQENNFECKLYYENFYDNLGSTIYTLEHMLRVQWFLKNYKINYFFTIYQDFVLDLNTRNPEASYLFEMLDMNNFLPVTSCGGYMKNRFNLNEGVHPDSLQHKTFTDDVIVPWIVQKNII